MAATPPGSGRPPCRLRRAGYAELDVTDLAHSVDFYTRVVGLTLVERDSATAYLRAGREHHALVLHAAGQARLRHLAYETHDDSQTEALRAALAQLGAGLAEAPEQPGRLGAAFRFQDAEGNWSEVYRAQQLRSGTPAPGGGTLRLGHFALGCADVDRQVAFYRALGLRLSDRRPGAAWLRCNPEHHVLALFGVGAARYLHLAVDVGGWQGVLAALEGLRREGWAAEVGPVRHAEGDNVSIYVPDPDGLRVEFYADMERIDDDEDHVRPDHPPHFNLWLRSGRPDGFFDQLPRDAHGRPV